MNNQRPLSKRKAVQLLVILTILAWATQTLLHQWGYGAEPPADTGANTLGPDAIGAEKFVSGGGSSVGGTLELRGEATVLGGEIKLKQICRWSDAQAPLFSQLADLTIVRVGTDTAFKSISVADIKQTLRDAGVNVALINFSGPANCTITRSDARIDEHEALRNWIDSQQTPKARADNSPPTRPAILASAVTGAAKPELKPEQPAVRSLRDLLTADIAQRLGFAPEMMQMTFNPEDEKVLSLAEPYFKFNIQPLRDHSLGLVSWNVTIITDSGTKKAEISATARAWQNQVVVVKPLGFRQLLEDSDFTERRVLVDVMPEQVLLRRDQCVGQQASADLKPGDVMTARLVDPVPLVRPGQLVTISLQQGTVRITAVGVAMEQGTLGQTIKVRNETTREIFDATVTGQQEARLGGAKPNPGVAAANGN
jgi:flagella basal body P-ring formation protein FlgA